MSLTATGCQPGLAGDSSSDDGEPSNQQDHHRRYCQLLTPHTPSAPGCCPCNKHSSIHPVISTAIVTIYFGKPMDSKSLKRLLLTVHAFTVLNQQQPKLIMMTKQNIGPL